MNALHTPALCKQLVALATLLLFVLAVTPAAAQSDATHAPTAATFAGEWTMALDGPSEMITWPLHATYAEENLGLKVTTGHGDHDTAAQNVSLEEGKLKFDLPLGHATIACVLYHREEKKFSGLCTGPMGEFPTTLKPAVLEGEGQ